MLEQKSLRILSWSPAPASIALGRPAEPGSRSRDIVDPETGAALGRALGGHCNTPGWMGWLFPGESSVAVYETEDDSLLMTIHGSGMWRFWRWKRRKPCEIGSERHWEVRDAEGNLVGRIERTGDPATPTPSDFQASSHTLASALAWDRLGRGLFLAGAQPGQLRRKFLGTLPQGAPSWIELGTFSCDRESVVIEFSDLVREEPFVKMLMLAMGMITNPAGP